MTTVVAGSGRQRVTVTVMAEDEIPPESSKVCVWRMPFAADRKLTVAEVEALPMCGDRRVCAIVSKVEGEPDTEVPVSLCAAHMIAIVRFCGRGDL